MHDDLCQRERSALVGPDDFGVDHVEILLQHGQRRLPHALWKCASSEESSESVCQREELQLGVVGPECLAGERVHLTTCLPSLIHC